MLFKMTQPKSKQELIQALRQCSIDEIHLLEPFSLKSQKREFNKVVEAISRKDGFISIIIVRHK
jgi:hypothetical protein